MIIKATQVKEKSIEQVWTTRTGAKIPVSELSDSHLLNILKMIHRQCVSPAFGKVLYELGAASSLTSGSMAEYEASK